MESDTEVARRRSSRNPALSIRACRAARCALLCAAALLLAGTATLAAAAALVEVRGFGSNPGNLKMFKFVPPSLPAGAPLVVALHGCTQKASDYDDETGWVGLAQRFKFALLLPEQQPDNNQNRCFNWFNGSFDPWSLSTYWRWFQAWLPAFSGVDESGSDQDRDEGEALSIKQMIDRMAADHAIDRHRIYVTGLSGGGAMTAVMLATYPDVFAGGAIIAGIPYKCARDLVAAAAQCGIDATHSHAQHLQPLTAREWARLVQSATETIHYQGPWPRVSIWHGDVDRVVSPEDENELIKQWTAVHGVDTQAGVEDKVKGFRHVAYRDAQGNVAVEAYFVRGMDHGVPIDPGTGNDQCGRPGRWVLAAGICSSFYIAKFWGLVTP
ncbi:MAG: PHB depolymerase family esterase [Sulfurifustis sp.]